MDFRLIYTGKLPSGNRSHTKAKHAIRKIFHKQLLELWKQAPELHRQLEEPLIVYTTPPNQISDPGPNVTQIVPTTKGDLHGKPWVERLADSYTKFGFRFVPLVRKVTGFACALDILFLRRDSPGRLVKHGGDIDNRIKVLFDAFRIVDNASELAGATPEIGEDPFFCLLEDDILITEVAVTTDRLLTPMENSESIDDVHLIIQVKLTDPGSLLLNGRLV